MNVASIRSVRVLSEGKSLPDNLQQCYTQLIGEIGRANGAGKNAADVPQLKAGIDAFQRDVAMVIATVAQAATEVMSANRAPTRGSLPQPAARCRAARAGCAWA